MEKLRTWEGKWVPKMAKQINGTGRRIWVSWLLIKHCFLHILQFLAWVALDQNRAFDIKSLWDFFFPKFPAVTRNCGRKQTLKSKFVISMKRSRILKGHIQGLHLLNELFLWLQNGFVWRGVSLSPPALPNQIHCLFSSHWLHGHF